MSTATLAQPVRASTNLTDRVNDLIAYIAAGRILDAMTEFYADDVTMRENNNAPTVGLEANIEREKQFLAAVREFKAFDVGAVAVDDVRGKALVQSTLEFVGVDGKTNRIDQVAAQTWRDGKIVDEKFYYDTGATK